MDTDEFFFFCTFVVGICFRLFSYTGCVYERGQGQCYICVGRCSLVWGTLLEACLGKEQCWVWRSGRNDQGQGILSSNIKILEGCHE